MCKLATGRDRELEMRPTIQTNLANRQMSQLAPQFEAVCPRGFYPNVYKLGMMHRLRFVQGYGLLCAS